MRHILKKEQITGHIAVGYEAPSLSLSLSKERRKGQVPLLLRKNARPVRFIGTGLLAGSFQLGSLYVLVEWGMVPLLANVIAFLIGTQVSFFLSMLFTWYDRPTAANQQHVIIKRWVRFMVPISITGILNQAIFFVAEMDLPVLLASLLGAVTVSILNYFIGDRFIFRASHKGEKSRVL